MLHHRLVIALVWIFSVLFFSLIYWYAWHARPDSFILNKEFNLTPYDKLTDKLWSPEYDAMWDPSSLGVSSQPIEIDDFYKRVNELNREAAAAQTQLSALEKEQAAIELAAKPVYEEHSEKLWLNVEKYKKTAIAAESAEVERMTAITDDLIAAAQRSPSSGATIAVANARVELAGRKYALAVKNAAVAEYVLRNLREFSDPDMTARFEATEAKLATVRLAQNDLVQKLGDFRTRAFKLLDDWHSVRTDRLKWIDFLYFSVGVSTTTTFGDIIPNSRLVRVSTLIQLVLSMLLVGYLVSLLGPVQSKP